jgi:hypothetical protein
LPNLPRPSASGTGGLCQAQRTRGADVPDLPLHGLWNYPVEIPDQGTTGHQAGGGCSSKTGYATKEEAEQARVTLNGTRYHCWCGAVAPMADLDLEVYECSTLKKDWHLAPQIYPAEAHKTWNEETREIVRSNWGTNPPWEVARQVNRFLWPRGSNGKTHHHARIRLLLVAG